MSAYMVDLHHVLYLVDAAAALSFDHCRAPFRWYWSEVGMPASSDDLAAKSGGLVYVQTSGEIRIGAEDEERAAVASMLWAENERSVDARYPSSARKPGEASVYAVAPEQAGRFRWPSFDPVAVLKACSCFEYQCCETDDWETTQAARFVRGLVALAIARLPGYDAAKWGAPEPVRVLGEALGGRS